MWLNDFKSIKDRKCFIFAIDRLSKNSRGYLISMIDLGKFKEVTTVIKGAGSNIYLK